LFIFSTLQDGIDKSHPSHLASPHTPHRTLQQFLPSPAHKRVRPDSPLPASRPPQEAIRTDTASPEPLKTHNATERKTTQPRLRCAEAAPTRHGLPEDRDSKSRGAKKYWLQSHN
jgi:hypothetical protein